MRWLRLFLFGLLICLPLAVADESPRQAFLLDIKGPVGPAVADYVRRGLVQAKDAGAEIVILRMDTPGGLDKSMRDIIRAILASPVPVISYVGPSGARAASAGTYILYASHVAAMAPGTNLGAATPVSIGGVPTPEPPSPGKKPKPPGDKEKKQPPKPQSAMERKAVNDAVAYIRSLAQMRGRNAKWAEAAVRKAASLSSEDALKKNVIDLISRDVPELLRQLEGRKVSVLQHHKTLHTAGAEVLNIEPDWRSRLLAVITDPNVAYLLMLLGFYGLFFELMNPGFVLPGVIGAICLLLALFAFQVLPVNYAGLGLMLLGIAFMIGEVFAPSFGALGIGGLIAFVIGSIILMDTSVPGFGISGYMIAAVSLTTAAFFIFVVGMAIKARMRPVVTGRKEMIGSVGEAVGDFTGKGRVHIHGEIWQAHSNVPVKAGQTVHVIDLHGLVLHIEPETQEEENS